MTTLQSICTNNNESGIVLFPDKTAIICNWADVEGIPRLFEPFGVIGTSEEFTAVKRFETDSWKKFVDGCEIIYDANGDYTDEESEGGAEVIELDNEIIILAPYDWA